jgi:hypothetical protein
MSSFNTEKSGLSGLEVGDVTPANIEQLKTININTLPGRFSKDVYEIPCFFSCPVYGMNRTSLINEIMQ